MHHTYNIGDFWHYRGDNLMFFGAIWLQISHVWHKEFQEWAGNHMAAMQTLEFSRKGKLNSVDMGRA